MSQTDRSPYFIPHGTTEPLDFQLRDYDSATTDEAGDVIDLTGMTVTLQAFDRNGTAVTLAGTVSIVTAATGSIRYTPAAETDFDNYASEGPWRVRFKVSDGTDHFFVPNDEDPDLWVVDK